MYFFSDSGWDDNDAKVVCRMIGFETDYAKSTRHSAFGELQSSFVFTYVGCNGTEDSIKDCYSEECDPIFENCGSPAPSCDLDLDDAVFLDDDAVFGGCATTESPIFENCGTGTVAGVVCYGKHWNFM